MRIIALVIAIAIGCGGSPAEQPQPQVVAQPVARAETRLQMLVRRADEARAALDQPDYRRPFQEQPNLALQVSDLYLEACREGDPRSCWIAAPLRFDRLADDLIARNCRAGDQLSCRAWLRAGPVDKSIPGWAGESDCAEPECDQVLREECRAGFPRSCLLLESEDQAERRLQREQTLARFREGCRAGLHVECVYLLPMGKTDADRRLTWMEICKQGLKDCLESPHGTPLENRDVLERACQYGHVPQNTCPRVLQGYVGGAFTEPVPDRARSIAAFLCGAGAEPAACLEELERKDEAKKRPARRP